MNRTLQFVQDGYRLAYAALEPSVRAAVEAEFAERLAVASLIERWQLRRAMAREVERRLQQMAPPDALY